MLDRAKLVSLRVCTHRTLGFAKTDERLVIAKPVLKLLTDIVGNEGLINENTNEG
jgi:sister-chromatid-cohesion protein PDS5